MSAASEVREVLATFGVSPRLVRRVGGGHDSAANANWHVWPLSPGAGERCVLRRYHDRATPDDLAYEHTVVAHLDRLGWVVPALLAPMVSHGDRWWALTRYVPGRARTEETPGQQRQRGADLARLDLALRELTGRLGQRPGWRPQHTAPTVHTQFDFDAIADGLRATDARLGDWLAGAAAAVAARLADIGARDLPLTVVHGDFAQWNVHYDGARLAGVVDFGLCHLDSRPYELAIARSYRAPDLRLGYREELERLGWPLSELEATAIEPVDHAFRVDMATWAAAEGLRTGRLDADFVERQLARTHVPPP